ncbi:hypothetical protein [Microvirga sp. TS319]|uniref:hypothetical protein n=1 Tax=Microvirga sp. TS319 TaxID=3241165 RepID=UPI00351A8CD1
MPSPWKECEEIARIDEEIAAGQQRVAERIHLIQWLTGNGGDTAEIRKLLQDDEQALRRWREHRLNLLEDVARHEEPEL